MDIIVSVILLALGLGIIGLFIAFVLRGFSLNLPRFFRGRPQSSLKARINKVDLLVANEQFHEALGHLESCFLIFSSKNRVLSPSGMLAHNLTCLERGVELSHKMASSVDNLGRLEMLFDEQARLASAYYEVSMKYRKLKAKNRWHIRKKVHWADDEFSKKLHELEEKLELNGKEIKTNLRRLISSLENARSQKDVTLH
jgi:hypothetical protein